MTVEKLGKKFWFVFCIGAFAGGGIVAVFAHLLAVSLHQSSLVDERAIAFIVALASVGGMMINIALVSGGALWWIYRKENQK